MPITLALSLEQRVAEFPQWRSSPDIAVAIGDLVYPDWFAGDWQMVSTLEAMYAPFAPTVVTPGFEQQAVYLHQPIVSQVRFGLPPQAPTRSLGFGLPLAARSQALGIVADRAFNGLSLAQAYLGKAAVLSVQVDPQNPNRQITQLQGDRQLVSIVTGRQTETVGETQFLTTELFQQQFQRHQQPYWNTVETTTAYQYRAEPTPEIRATQLTAVYLSPQDPNYFQVQNQPVALYRYTLALTPLQMLTHDVSQDSAS